MIVATQSMAPSAYASSSALISRTEKEISLSLSAYQYQEPYVMSSKGGKVGVDLHATKAWQNESFIRADLRYAFGLVDYQGSGTSTREPDWYVEARGLFGKDWAFNNVILSPYSGIGYRYLFNDARGITSTGYSGYRRESNYLYLPVGVIHRSKLNNQARLVNTLEFDYLLAGRQYSRLSDTGLGYGDAKNEQNSGYGLKWSVIYEKDNWTIGPYSHYWNIGRSVTERLIQNGSPVGVVWEPANNTVEFGLQFGKQF